MNAVLMLAAIGIFKVDPYNANPHVFDKLSDDAVETNTISAVAARGEFESVSWVIRPDTDLAKVDFVFSDLKGPNGAVIPKGALDLKSVKCWYQPEDSWVTSWARPWNRYKHVPCPGPLLHDDGVIKVDHEKKENYVRCDYAHGSVYKWMSDPNGPSTFNTQLNPVKDAAAFVPFDVPKGFHQQYWLTYRVPREAKGGKYAGTAAVLANGNEIGEIKLELEVYPFVIPSARTHYDSSRPFMCSMIGVDGMDAHLREGLSFSNAQRRAFNLYKLLADHNVTHPHGPGVVRSADTDDFAIRNLHLMRAAGLPCKPLFAANAADDSWFTPTKEKKTPTKRSNGDPGEFKVAMEHADEYIRRMNAAFDKYLGHHDAYYSGLDEADPWLCRWQYATWSVLKRHGGKIFATKGNWAECGWSIDCSDATAWIGPTEARHWHEAGGIVMSYAAPFTGPDCPVIWRRTKGLRLYFADYDGPNDYCLCYPGRTRWNEFLASPDEYRTFGIVYPAADGYVGTVALEALREGVDDVRYLSLLKMRAEAAMASKDAAAVRLGRTALAWLDSRDPDRIPDLDAFRAEVARRIVALAEKVGYGPEEPEVKPLGELPPWKAERIAADASLPAAKRAAECAALGCWDLAIPLYVAARREADADKAGRLAFALAETRLRLGLGDRMGAVAVVEEELADRRRHTVAGHGELLFAKVDALLAPIEFREEFDEARLERARATLMEAIKVPGVSANRRSGGALRIAVALLNSKDPVRTVAFADTCREELKLDKRTYGSLLFTGVGAFMRLGRHKEAYGLAKKCVQYGADNVGVTEGDSRQVTGTCAELAEKCADWVNAQKYFEMAVSYYTRENDYWYPRYKAGLVRVTPKANAEMRKSAASKIDALVEGTATVDDISLDE